MNKNKMNIELVQEALAKIGDSKLKEQALVALDSLLSSLKEAESYCNDTVWRLTKSDFEYVIEEYYPELEEEKINEIIEIADDKFHIHDWEEHVKVFVGMYANK